MTIKDDLHHLVDELDEDAAEEALHLLLDHHLSRKNPVDRGACFASRGADEEAEIDAEYERAYRDHPIDEEERRVLDAFSQAGIRSLQRPPGPRG
jgi:hypothetical protein